MTHKVQQVNANGELGVVLNLANHRRFGLPLSPRLISVYPNPFNPTTTIKFGLPSDINVDLRVYDILGQEVKVLMNNQLLRAGVHVVNFNASQLASGTYIYRLRAGNNVTIKKMMLLK